MKIEGEDKTVALVRIRTASPSSVRSNPHAPSVLIGRLCCPEKAGIITVLTMGRPLAVRLTCEKRTVDVVGVSRQLGKLGQLINA